MNPEKMAMRNVDRSREKHLELSLLMTRAHEKATREVLSNPEYAIQESEFATTENPIYTSETVAKDKLYVASKKKQFEAMNSTQDKVSLKIADTLEAIILMQSELGNWLGDATTLKASQFDDIANKVDMLAEWTRPGGVDVLALGIDVTYSMSSVQKKLLAIKEEIDRGELGKVKYFRDQDSNFMGTRNNVPRAIVGVSSKTTEELAGLWVNNDNKTLGAHPAQRILVDEIGTQLRTIHEYAQRRGNHRAAQAYERAHNLIRPIQVSKAGIRMGEYSEDSVLKEILFQTRAVFK